jgi:hypothetical protein
LIPGSAPHHFVIWRKSIAAWANPKPQFLLQYTSAYRMANHRMPQAEIAGNAMDRQGNLPFRPKGLR